MTLYYWNVTDVTRDGCYDFFCFFHLSLKLLMYFSYALAWMDICWCQTRCYSENGSGILIDLFLWHYLRDGCYGIEILMCSWWQSSDTVSISTICINKLFFISNRLVFGKSEAGTRTLKSPIYNEYWQNIYYATDVTVKLRTRCFATFIIH